MTTMPSAGEDLRIGAPTAPWWHRPSSVVAVALLVASLAMIAFNLASLVTPGWDQLPNHPDSLNVIVVAVAFAALPTVGAILAIQRPGNPMGWIFLLAGVSFTLSPEAEQIWCDYTTGHVNQPGPIALDGEVISTPTIQAAICGGRTIITVASCGSVFTVKPSRRAKASMRSFSANTKPSMHLSPRTPAPWMSSRISLLARPAPCQLSATVMANSQLSPPGRT